MISLIDARMSTKSDAFTRVAMVLYAQSFGALILAICENLSKVSIILNSIYVVAWCCDGAWRKLKGYIQGVINKRVVRVGHLKVLSSGLITLKLLAITFRYSTIIQLLLQVTMFIQVHFRTRKDSIDLECHLLQAYTVATSKLTSFYIPNHHSHPTLSDRQLVRMCELHSLNIHIHTCMLLVNYTPEVRALHLYLHKYQLGARGNVAG